MQSRIHFLRQLDAFSKPLKDFRVKTASGALVTICSSLVIFALLISEYVSYREPHTKQEIIVDISRTEKLLIVLDITYFYVPCGLLSLDAMDETGEQKMDIQDEIYRTPIDVEGKPLTLPVRSKANDATDFATKLEDPNYCGSCYGAGTMKCCNTCKDVKQAYHEMQWEIPDISLFEQCRGEAASSGGTSELGNQGCRVHGKLHVNKVAGSFHLSLGDSFARDHVHVHDLRSVLGKEVNMSHKITNLSFGEIYPGQVNPLNGQVMHVLKPAQMVSYYLKLVPTIYNHHNTEIVETNQYSVTYHIKGTPLSGDPRGIPGLFFTYEISPLLVKITRENKSFLHFLTNTCAIVGGVFTVASLLDGFIYQSSCFIRKRASGHAS